MDASRTVFLIGVVVLVTVPAKAESLRCQGGIVSEGDSRLSVVYKCGQPNLTDQYCAPVLYGQTLTPVPDAIASLYIPCQQVEHWLYERGPGNLVATVRLRGGKVQSITYGRAPRWRHAVRVALARTLGRMIDAKHFQREQDGTWTTGVAFDDSGALGKLTLRCDSGAVKAPHVSAGVEVARRWSELRQSLTPALWAFYLRVESWATQSGPRIETSEQVWQQLSLSEVEVVLDRQGKVLWVHGHGHCEWEAEHGLELVLDGGGTPVYVGPYEGWIPSDLHQPNDWNFASKSVQDSVFAEPRRTPEQEPELVQHQEPSTNTPGHRKKPWWRLW